jgi:hypothetical protein
MWPGNLKEGGLENRKRYVVDRAFQQRIALHLTLIVLSLPVVMAAGLFVAWGYVSILNPGIAEAPLSVGLLGKIVVQAWWLVILLSVVFIVLSFGLIFFYTNRIAGPIYRFRHVLDNLAEGKIHIQVKLREGDSFENLSTTILRANATLASAFAELKTAAALLAERSQSSTDDQLKTAVTRISRVLDRYQVIAGTEGPVSQQESINEGETEGKAENETETESSSSS